MVNFGAQFRRRYSDHGDLGGGGGGIEFRPHRDDESGVTSPPLWHRSAPNSPPTETTPLQSHTYNHNHYQSLSPTSRLEAITRGKEELMEMVKNMPESNYELSLKDMVDQSRSHGIGQTAMGEERRVGKEIGGKRKKKNNKPQQILRSESFNNGPFLLKMFIPTLGLKKKKSTATTGTCAKVSPRPVEGDRSSDKDWWKKRFSVIGETGGSSSSQESRGSRNSSSSRNKGDSVPNCWSFFNVTNMKTKE